MWLTTQSSISIIDLPNIRTNHVSGYLSFFHFPLKLLIQCGHSQEGPFVAVVAPLPLPRRPAAQGHQEEIHDVRAWVGARVSNVLISSQMFLLCQVMLSLG